jgi:hypothetical protein
MTTQLRPPFTNLQMEMISLFAKEVPEPQLIEIKTMIAKYLLEKARDFADAAWNKKGYTQNTLEQLLNQDEQ